MSKTGPLKAFRELVKMKYQIYNGLFLTLPFEDMESSGALLPIFASYAHEHLEAGKSPTWIVEKFCKEKAGIKDFKNRAELLFKFLQFVERQVVLFDSLEDSAYDQINDLEGSGSLKEFFAKIETTNRVEEYRQYLHEFKTRIVLTAHPTQFYPDEVLGIITDLTGAVKSNDIPAINDLLLQMGKTRFKNKVKPTPIDEAKSILWYLEHIFYETLPSIQARLATETLGEKAPGVSLDSKIDLGFWPGGDRDGNPFVTADITLETASLLRSSLQRLYRIDVEKLLRRLTFDGVIEKMEVIYSKILGSLITTRAVSSERLLSAPPKTSSSEKRYVDPEDFLNDLLEVRALLIEKHEGLFVDKLDALLYKIRLFGFHFASMDLRQDSRIHGQTMNEIFEALLSDKKSSEANKKLIKEYQEPERSELEKISILEKLSEEIPIGYGIELPLEGIARDTLLSIRAAMWIQLESGSQGLHRYIISNTQSALNLFEVWFMAQLGGMKREALPIDIVPLFETVEDLGNADSIMEMLYTHPVYTAHLKGRKNVQPIMLGFSDGTKDGGYVTANWEIFRAKERLTGISQKHDVRVIFFDGRGGPPSRGGGNTHKFYRSLGSKVEHREIQLTIQGQTISSKYGTEHSCRHNFEQLISASLELHLFPENVVDLTPEDISLLDHLSVKSRESYLRFRQHEKFLPYLEEMTPLEFYGLTNIGSRPAKRGKSTQLKFEDLRAIPFVGAWSQMKQNIPGFFGFGEGLDALVKSGKKKQIVELYQRSLFFRTLVENTIQSLSKSYFPLTQSTKRDPQFGDFWKWIHREAETTQKILLEISGQKVLMESDPSLRESIDIREHMVLPLLVIQQYALSQLREIKKSAQPGPAGAVDTFQKIVIKSLAANINASRNSA